MFSSSGVVPRIESAIAHPQTWILAKPVRIILIPI